MLRRGLIGAIRGFIVAAVVVFLVYIGIDSIPCDDPCGSDTFTLLFIIFMIAVLITLIAAPILGAYLAIRKPPGSAERPDSLVEEDATIARGPDDV